MGDVPVTANFQDVYPDDAQQGQRQRWNSLLKSFDAEYGLKAEFIARSPGRVNIIGEHIDYSLYQCLPMAVAVDVLLAVCVRPGSSQIRIANVNGQKFPSRVLELPKEGLIDIDANSHHWSNYFKSGLRGACELLQRKQGSTKSVGMDIMVDGNVPAGGGLSSSAAFVCASALATMFANGERAVDKKELVEVAIVSERAVGVNSGGMDQSASVFPVRDSAILVSFKPELKADLVSFPSAGPELVFMVAQSLVVSNKQETAPIHYNLRVVECALAALLLAKIFRLKRPLPADAGPLGISLRGFHDTFFEESDGIADNTTVSSEEFKGQLEKLIQMTGDYVNQEEGYSREELSEILQVPLDELEQKYIGKVPIRAERFKLRHRALHVFSEALRVQRFMDVLTSKTESPAEIPSKLGSLLVEVQESCRDLYECSCPELDDLCKIALAAGAYGGRVTGAGWGGCSVHLVPKDKVEKVAQAWKDKYYSKRFPKLSADELDEAIVVSKPGGGAIVWEGDGRATV